MKKIFGILAAITMCATASFASTARIEALGGAIHLTDAVTIFANPSDMNKLPDAAIVEYGNKNAASYEVSTGTAVPQALGGFVKSMDSSKIGFFLGYGTDSRDSAKATAGTVAFENVENPFTVLYGSKAGDIDWGVAFTYSSSAKKSNVAGATPAGLDAATQSKMSLAGSVAMGDMNFGLNLGLGDTAKTSFTNGNNANFAGTEMSLFGYYSMDTMTFGLNYGMAGKKIDSTAASTKEVTEDSSATQITLSALNEVKKEGVDFFYGLQYVTLAYTDKADTPATKYDRTSMPVLIGVEADAASWLVLRGSVQQNVLLGSEKSGTKTDSLDHNTNVNAGLGFKFNKSVLDMTLSAASNGTVAANSLGAKAAYTYLF